LETHELGDYEIPVATSIKLILENAKSVGIVLCVTSSSIKESAGFLFLRFLETTLGKLIKNHKNEGNKDAIYLMITRPHMVGIRNPRLYNVDDAKNELEELKNSFSENGGSPDFLNFILRDDGKYISVCDPLDRDGNLDIKAREEYIKTFENMTPITNCKDAFQVAYSENVELKLLKKFTTISEIGCNLFERINQNFKEIKKINHEIEFISKEISNKNDNILKLKNKSEMSLIEESDKIQIESLRINIIEKNREIDSFFIEKTKFGNKIEEIKECIKREDDKGNDSLLYWENSYQEEAKWSSYTYENLETDYEFQARIGSIGGGFEQGFLKLATAMGGKQLKQRTGSKGLPITKLLEYPKGIEIDKVEKIPIDTKYWSQETENPKGKKHFSVLYTTGDGEKADAKIQIYALYKNHPDAIEKMEGLVEEQKLQEGFFKKKEIEIENAQKLLNDKEDLKKRTEEHLGKIGNDSENCSREIDSLQKEIKSLEESQGNFRLQEKDLLKNIENLKKEINENKDDFDFVVDFLSFENNKTILDNKKIQTFKENYEKHKISNNN
jgi:hypothetical protein